MNNLYKLLDKIENTIVDGIPIPLLPFTVVNHDKIYGLLDKVHTALPEEVQMADQILNRREQILEEAQRKAELTIEEAKHRANEMLHDSELLRAIRQEAERIRTQVLEEVETMRMQAQQELIGIQDQAIEEASIIRNQADEYANAVLKNLSDSLGDFLSISEASQKQLIKTRQDLGQKHQKQLAHYGHDKNGVASRLISNAPTAMSGQKNSKANKNQKNTDPLPLVGSHPLE